MAKSKPEEAVKRRVRAGRLLLAGKSPPEVARLVGAPRQTVYCWRDVLNVGGIEALRDMSKGGRPSQLGAAELSRLYVALLEGVPVNPTPGACTILRSLPYSIEHYNEHHPHSSLRMRPSRMFRRELALAE